LKKEMNGNQINRAMHNQSQQNRAPAECVIEVNKKGLNSLYDYVREVTVNLKRNVSGTATIVLDSFRDERGRWLVQDSGLLQPWDEVQISASFGRPENDKIMHGYIREVKQEYPDDMGAAQVTVEVQDDLLKLDREQVHGVLSHEGEEKSDGALVRELAGQVGMECITEKDVSGKELGLTPGALHINTTPVKFLRKRAEANGFELYTREGKLYFHPPRLKANPQPSILVYAGSKTNCIRFNLQHDGHRPDKVRLMREAENEKDKDSPPREFEPRQIALGNNALTSEGRGLRQFVWSIDRPIGANEAEVESLAQAKANENQFKIKAQGVLDGTIYGYVLLPHLPVEVDGIGETYGGIYYVDEVTHKFTSGGYQQHFKLIRNATN
jgi:hypothetical protein